MAPAITAPGGFEGFFGEVGGVPTRVLELPPPSAPDIQRLGALAAKYQVEVLGPLPD